MKKIKHLVMKKISEDYVLIPCRETAEEMGDVITLSETAAYIYQMVDQCDTVEEIVQKVSRHYEIAADTIRQDITDTLHQLSAAGLIVL